MMKKLMVLTFMLLSSISYASAKWTTYYIVEQDEEFAVSDRFKIDWEDNFFFLDSDSEDETKAPIKNLKTNGNTKTFDVYYTPSVGGGKYCSVKFITEGEGKFTLIQTLQGVSKSAKFGLSDKKPMKDAIRDARQNPKELIKGGVEKISNVFKKKDKKKE